MTALGTVKKVGIKHSYTQSQTQELVMCAKDPYYFITHYCMVQHPSRGAILFEPRPYQQRVIKNIINNIHTIILSARQTGKTTTTAGYLLWYAIFQDNKTVLIASNKKDNAKEILHRIKYMYEFLPDWLKPGATEWNKHDVGFENGSRIISQATTANTGRSLSISCLFCDELAFVPDNITEEFWSSISPTLANGGKSIICSTPNGDTNLFAELWRGANIPGPNGDGVGMNGYSPSYVAWTDPPGRDEAFKRTEIAKIGQLLWDQEYECKFVSSDPLLVSTHTLTALTPIVEKSKPVGKFGETVFYDRLEGGTTYLVGMDVSTGTGKDNTVIEVFKFPEMTQVAEYVSNTTSPSKAYQVLKILLKHLESHGATVYFSVENNSVGASILALLEVDLSPPTAELVSESGKDTQGFTTTGASKLKVCVALKDMLERRLIHIKSKTLLMELKSFVRARGSYQAKRGATDDCVMATTIVLRILEHLATFDDVAYVKMNTIDENEFEGLDLWTEYDDDTIDPMVF